MKDEPEFKWLQGNPAFFWVRASRGPFHLRQKTQGPSHIHIAEGKLLLKCLWKGGSPLQSKTGNQLSSWGDMEFMELSLSCCTEINIHIYVYLRESPQFPKGSQATCPVWCGTQDSYGANIGEMGFISSWFGIYQAILHSWDDFSVHLALRHCSCRLSGVPSRKSRLLNCLIGNTGLLCTQCSRIESHLPARGCLMGFLELRQEPGVYYRVTAGMAFRNSTWFSEVWSPV